MLPEFIKGIIKPSKTSSKLNKKTLTQHNETPDLAGVLKFLNKSELLERHERKIENIYQTLSISRAHFKKLYLPLISNLAELVQQIPASENHHHAQLGGLLEHSLEVGVFAARLRQGVMIRGVAEDQMAIVSEALSYAVITAALLHDVGKVVTDVQIANLTKNTTFLPLVDFPKVGEKYTFRYKKDRVYSDHQKANLQLSIKLMPEDGIRWLSQYSEIYQHWMRTLAGEYSDAGDIGRIVARADSTSTQRATISAEAMGDVASQNPLSKLTPADTFVRILRSIMETQPDSIPLNKRGAAAWVTADNIYFVSKRVIDEVKKAAERLGPAVSLPADNSTIMTTLGDAKKIKLTAEGKAIHNIQIKEGNWEVKMTFIVFPREQIDPAGKLAMTQNILIDSTTGELIHPLSQTATEQSEPAQEPEQPPTQLQQGENEPPQDESFTLGNPTEGKNAFFTSYEFSNIPDEPPGLAGIAGTEEKQLQQSSRSSEQPELTGLRYRDQKNAESQLSPTFEATSTSTHTAEATQTLPNRAHAPLEKATSKKKEQAAITKKEMGLHFTRWLMNYITLHMDSINGPGSALHVLEPGHLVMITPSIFGQYLTDNQSFYSQYMQGDNNESRRAIITKIQFSVETQLTYLSSFNGQKIIKLKVRGNRHTGPVNGFILDQTSTARLFGVVEIPQPNQHLSILTPLS